MINRAMADALFPGSDPLGRRLRTGGTDGPLRTIVGVVDDVRHRGLDAADGFQVYLPMQQWWPETGMTLVVRAAGAPSAVAGNVRDAIHSIDRSVAITGVATLEELVTRSMAQRRFALWLFEGFALLALLLAAAGIYGVLSAGVVERVREIGIRSALGASRERILSMVLRQGLSLTSLGLVIGMVGAYALSRILATLLFGVRSGDPGTLIVVAGVLAATAAVACAVPAWRAARVDPMTALRE
jgi:putative ABC transport system permease protein